MASLRQDVSRRHKKRFFEVNYPSKCFVGHIKQQRQLLLASLRHACCCALFFS